MKIAVFACAALAAAAVASSAHAGLALSLSGPSTQSYTNGGGVGFGGVLGPATITFGSSGGNLNIGTNITAAALGNDNIVVIMLDVRNGGLADFEMSDLGDGGRRAISSPALNGILNHPTGMSTYAPGSGGGVADFGLAIGSFGSALFELTTGSLTFLQFNPAQNISIPASSIGSPTVVDWFAYYTSQSQFLSNESLPASPAFNFNGNFGFNTGATSLADFNRYLVPAPGAAALMGLGGLLVARRRR